MPVLLGRSHLLQGVERQAGLALQLRQPPLFQPPIVGVAQVVAAGHGMAGSGQAFADLGADKAGGAGAVGNC